MSTEITPRTMAAMITNMIKATKAAYNYPNNEGYYFVLKGPKRWMDLFVHLNNSRPYIFLQYGPKPDKSIKVYFSNTIECETFELCFHRYTISPIIGAPKKAGSRIFRAGFDMGDGRKTVPRSDHKCYSEPANPEVAYELAKSKKRDNVAS